MHILENDLLKIRINKIGAELCEINSVKNGTQFMWNADSAIWPNHAPNLFPIVGALKDNSYIFEGKTYAMSKHGFVRHNSKFEAVEETDTCITLRLSSDKESLKIYPFKFEYYVIYHLVANQLMITYKVVNIDSKPLYFSIGGHPAFKCPVYKYETYSDYKVIFEQGETSKTHLLNLATGLLTSQTQNILDSPHSIELRNDLFSADALIFKDLKSAKITLSSASNGDILSVHFKDFKYIGIWAKPNADYVCIEPWLGIADSENTNQQLTEKEGIMKLDSNETFEATFTIEIHKPHLTTQTTNS